MKSNIPIIKERLKKEKVVALVAPSFVSEFDYPQIIYDLKNLGFDKIVELTFGAKMINRLYHEKLKNSKEVVISSVCPGIVEIINNKYPHLKKNLINVDSPMTATAKICRKIYPKHKTCFISPCHFKKKEAENSKDVDYVVDYNQLKEMIIKLDKKDSRGEFQFDKFYNDYTKIYPLAGGLSKTAHLKGILKKNETKIIDGISNVEKYLNKMDKGVKFLDINFCVGGCIGGPCLTNKLTIAQRKKRVLEYMKKAQEEDIPENKKGLTGKALGIDFTR